mgnify:CR=1 FL=1
MLIDELEAFEYEYTRTGARYCAPEGVHDDTVCSLALAVQKFSDNLLHIKRMPSVGFKHASRLFGK